MQIPSIPENFGGVSLTEIELMQKVRLELGNTDAFSRANTTKGDRIRVSPISVSLDKCVLCPLHLSYACALGWMPGTLRASGSRVITQVPIYMRCSLSLSPRVGTRAETECALPSPSPRYIFAQTKLCKLRQHEASCTCSILINACAKLRSLQGGRISLRDLWKHASGAAPNPGGAKALLDRLVKAPVVAVRFDAAISNCGAWMVMAKEEGIDYSKFDLLLSALEPLPTLGSSLACRQLISTSRLRALKLMASCDADRKLIELAALDGMTRAEQQRVMGTNNLSTAQQRKEIEDKIELALASFEALTDLAKITSLSEVSSRLEVQILEEDIEIELQRLSDEVEPQELQERNANQAGTDGLQVPRHPAPCSPPSPSPSPQACALPQEVRLAPSSPCLH